MFRVVESERVVTGVVVMGAKPPALAFVEVPLLLL
jgi:hypothetical protein